MEAKSDAFGTDALETEIDAVAAAQEDRTGSGKHFDLSDAAPSPSKSPSGVKTLSRFPTRGDGGGGGGGGGGGAAADDASAGSKEDDMIATLQSAVRVRFVFDGAEHAAAAGGGGELEGEFKRGQTVEVLKAFVAGQRGIPIPAQQMFLLEAGAGGSGGGGGGGGGEGGGDGAKGGGGGGGRLMIDPLSLADYVEDGMGSKEPVLVRVVGEPAPGGGAAEEKE